MKDIFFLVIEGLDGSGKTDISRRLAETYHDRGDAAVLLTHEPDETCLAGSQIRDILKGNTSTPPHILEMLFTVNRADHVTRIIEPFLSRPYKKKIIVCDRYVPSSMVYQGVDEAGFKRVYDWNKDFIHPDAVVYLDVSPATCIKRVESRLSVPKELFEHSLETYSKRYRDVMDFLTLVKYSDIRYINNDFNIRQTMQQIFDLIDTAMEKS